MAMSPAPPREPPPADVDRVTMLVVDDDRAFRDALASAFTRRGYDVRVAGSCEEALRVCDAFVPERAVIDLRMPGGATGLDLLRELKRLDPGIAVVVLTGYGSIPTAIEAVKRGAVNYLTKPTEPAAIELAFAGDVALDGDGTTAPVPSVDRVSWEHIQRVLADCDGNISAAARQLGMHRRTLQRKLQKRPPPR
jgi:two-component system response regulator RegA